MAVRNSHLLSLRLVVVICSALASSPRSIEAQVVDPQPWTGGGELQCRLHLGLSGGEADRKALLFEIRNITNYPLAILGNGGVPLVEVVFSNAPGSMSCRTKGGNQQPLIVPAYSTNTCRIDEQYWIAEVESLGTSGSDVTLKRFVLKAGYSYDIHVWLRCPQDIFRMVCRNINLSTEGADLYVEDKTVWPERVKCWTHGELRSNSVRMLSDGQWGR